MPGPQSSDYRTLRPTIMDLDRFLREKLDETCQSLKASVEQVWVARWHNTEGFEEHWQGDEVFQDLFTGCKSLISRILSVECEKIRSDIITISCQCFEALRYYFDEHSDEFVNLSLDINTLDEDAGANIQPPVVDIWQQEWECMTTESALLHVNQNYRYETMPAPGTKGEGA
ncbi:hypothetical protein IWW34DRAFT_795275 [Fusarium oxysporum f. sp. albedinis]|nr:hypothetical protein IWW34DRAFT_795275 [Fusarium oxysporum f. sp. albedinis]KAI8396491.1 hypothetical protein FOFC_21039 [Fusarium oxysporum]KAK2470720.1 hypothetical protein H9L39_16951 [Fusarium oxysporum f. sp. albedinis]